MAGYLSCRRPEKIDGLNTQVRDRRLERPTPRSVRELGISASSRHQPHDSDTEITGGEFLPVEQRARAQSRGTATQLPQGHGYLFTTRDRPVRSARGWSAAPVRHGVSVVRSGERYALGLIFHDAA